MKLVLAIEDRRHKDTDLFIIPTLIGSYYNDVEIEKKAFSIGITWIWFNFGFCVLWGNVKGKFGFYNNFGK